MTRIFLFNATLEPDSAIVVVVVVWCDVVLKVRMGRGTSSRVFELRRCL